MCPPGQPKEFALLQLRPLVFSTEFEEIELDNIQRSDVICQSTQVLGNGVIGGIHDVVVVDIQSFDRSKSHEVAGGGQQAEHEAAHRPQAVRSDRRGPLGKS